MNFYESKLNDYRLSNESENRSLKQRMEDAKKIIDQKSQAEAQTCRQYYLASIHSSPINIYIDFFTDKYESNYYARQYSESQKYSDLISQFTPEEYFDYMARKECKDLHNYKNMAYKNQYSVNKRINDLTTNRGVHARLSNFLGGSEKELLNLVKKQSSLIEKYSLISQSQACWQDMDKETQTDYLVSRQENGIFNFDREGFEKFCETAHQSPQPLSLEK